MAQRRKNLDRLSNAMDGILKTEANADTESQTEQASQANPDTKTQSESQSHPDTKPNVKTDTVVEPQTKSQTYTKTNHEVTKEADVKTSAKPKAQPQTNQHVHTQTLSNRVASLKTRVDQGATKKTLEDTRKRQTYWLTSDEVEKVAELSKATGLTKYEVVGTAIQTLYDLVMDTDQSS